MISWGDKRKKLIIMAWKVKSSCYYRKMIGMLLRSQNWWSNQNKLHPKTRAYNTSIIINKRGYGNFHQSHCIFWVDILSNFGSRRNKRWEFHWGQNFKLWLKLWKLATLKYQTIMINLKNRKFCVKSLHIISTKNKSLFENERETKMKCDARITRISQFKSEYITKTEKNHMLVIRNQIFYSKTKGNHKIISNTI